MHIAGLSARVYRTKTYIHIAIATLAGCVFVKILLDFVPPMRLLSSRLRILVFFKLFAAKSASPVAKRACLEMTLKQRDLQRILGEF